MHFVALVLCRGLDPAGRHRVASRWEGGHALMKRSLTFGDVVELIATDSQDLRIGDGGEVVGLSEDGEYVGVWIDRFQMVYTVAVNDVNVRAHDGRTQYLDD